MSDLRDLYIDHWFHFLKRCNLLHVISSLLSWPVHATGVFTLFQDDRHIYSRWIAVHGPQARLATCDADSLIIRSVIFIQYIELLGAFLNKIKHHLRARLFDFDAPSRCMLRILTRLLWWVRLTKTNEQTNRCTTCDGDSLMLQRLAMLARPRTGRSTGTHPMIVGVSVWF